MGPFDTVDFNKFCDVEHFDHFGWAGQPVVYLRCQICSFIHTSFFDDWTTADFQRFVYNNDYVKVDGEYESVRPELVAKSFRLRLDGCEEARILDYGSGAGVFVDRLRADGFAHVDGYDPFSHPTPPDGLYDIITCFEVIEHAPDPRVTLADMRRYLAPGGCIILSQTLQPPNILSLRGNWWYVAPRNGHISMFTEEALLRLGRLEGFHLHVGPTVFGFAQSTRSVFAALALSRLGPSFCTLRLTAPTQFAHQTIRFDGDPVWLPVDQDSEDRLPHRAAATTTLDWDASWEPAEVIEVRIPVAREPAPEFMAGASVAFDRQNRTFALDRGEWVARFDTGGLRQGIFRLTTPAPVATRRHPAGVGVSIFLADPDIAVAGAV